MKLLIRSYAKITTIGIANQRQNQLVTKTKTKPITEIAKNNSFPDIIGGPGWSRTIHPDFIFARKYLAHYLAVWARLESNQGPLSYKDSALTPELRAQKDARYKSRALTDELLAQLQDGHILTALWIE